MIKSRKIIGFVIYLYKNMFEETECINNMLE